MPDDILPIRQAPEVASTPTSPLTKTLSWADMGVIPAKVIHLQKEMNMATGQLLTTRASIDTCHRGQVSDFEMAFCQNEAQATKAIREARPTVEHPLEKWEACSTAAIREVETHCTASIREAETTCATAIREAETLCADHAHTIQQSHSDSMQHLEREAIEEGERPPILPSHLRDGPAGLPPRSPRGTNVPSPVTDGEHVFGYSPGHSPSDTHLHRGTYPFDFLSNHSSSTHTLLRNQTAVPFAQPGGIMPQPADEVAETSEEPPHQKWKDGMPLKKL